MGMEAQSTRTADISIDAIPKDWMSDPGEMRPQLMGSSGDGTQPHPCDAIAFDPVQWTQNPPESGGRTTSRVKAVAGRLALHSCQGTVDSSTPIEMTMNIREVKLVHPTVGEQRAAAPQRFQSTRQQQNTGGVTVKPMHQTKCRIISVQPGDQ